MDSDEPVGSEVVCAAITLMIFNNYRTGEQQITECILMVKTSSDPNTYRRIGRGRAVESGWLDACTTELFNIV
jgi:hypothetical protein